MDKGFLSYQQQIRHLNIDKRIICRDEEDEMILRRCGYFNLVNGYKEPFVADKDPSTNKHIYYKGTQIKYLYYVKEFDDELRFLLFKYIIKVEEEVRTFAAYKFDEVNGNGEIGWYHIDAYNPNRDIKDILQFIKFISSTYSQIENSKLQYVRFYKENHKVIPTWILIKLISFSFFIDFIDLSKNEVKDALCKLYSIYDENGNYGYSILRSGLQLMRLIRNKCAHNERLYTYAAGKRIKQPFKDLTRLPDNYLFNEKQNITDLLVYLKYFLKHEDFETLINTVKNMLFLLQHKIPYSAFEYIRGQMGIKNIEHLDLLLKDKKVIEYNDF